MKKTLLILLTSVSFLSISACYTTPEMDELRTRVDYENTEEGCSAEADYLHEGLRNCIESRMAFDDENKKTVTIVPTKKGTLVIPRAYDDETMMDTSRIYERVDINDKTVVIEDGSAPKNTFMTETTTIIETSRTSEETSSENVERESFEAEAVVAEQPIEDNEDDVNESEEFVEEENVEEKPNVVVKVETKSETNADPVAVVENVKEAPATVVGDVEEVSPKRAETIVETEIIAPTETKVKTEILAEPESVIEIEKKVGDIEVKKTVTVTKKEEVKAPVKEVVESKKEEQKVEEVQQKPAGQTVTVVVTPSTDDVVVSVGLGEQTKTVDPKTETKAVQTTKTTTVTTEKKEKTETFKKNEKEVLPIEEK